MKMATPLHLEKKGIRTLAIAESFKVSCKYAVLVGVVMRRDLIIDGIVISSSTLRGDDSTQNIISMFRKMNRNDINCILIGGMIISMFNIIDGDRIFQSTGLPVIAVTYNRSRGLVNTIKKVFPHEWRGKLQQYQKLGKRERIELRTGNSVYVRQWGLNVLDATYTLNCFTRQGSIPEPIRIAKLIARASIVAQKC